MVLQRFGRNELVEPKRVRCWVIDIIFGVEAIDSRFDIVGEDNVFHIPVGSGKSFNFLKEVRVGQRNRSGNLGGRIWSLVVKHFQCREGPLMLIVVPKFRFHNRDEL